MTPDPMSSGPRRLGKYELQEVLGRGGMAEVWKAFDTQLRRHVAIKFMHANLATDPDFVSRFTREAQVIAALRHSNIVQIYDFYTSETAPAPAQATEGAVTGNSQPGNSQPGSSSSPQGSDAITAYMVMEYVKGQTLAQYISSSSRKGEFPTPSAILRLFTPISLALDYAHGQGAIHRDIKPANILLDQTNTKRNPMGEPILSDFGLARMMGASTQTVTGAVIGTPLYMSPEQIQSQPISARSDLYSLGIILYEICTGTPPFHSDSLTGMMMQHLTQMPPPPEQANPKLPPTLAPVLLKALAKQPQDRYGSAAEMMVAIAQAFNLPIPEELRPALADASQEPTLLSAPTIISGMAPIVSGASAADQATVVSSGGAYGAGYAAPSYPASGQAAVTPYKAVAVAPLSVSQTPPVFTPPPNSITAPPTTPSTRKRPPALWVGISLAVVAALLITGIGSFFLISHFTTPTASNGPVGQALYVSSGKLSQDATHGVNDEFLINLTGVPNPAQGKSYYAWLLPDVNQTEAPSLFLGKLTVNNGAIHFLYLGDTSHTNLLGVTSRFLITEESSSVTPITPTPDHNAWRYYAQLPQTRASGQQFSLLDHLRHLLVSDPKMESVQLHGGLNIWMLRVTKEVWQLAITAKDNWNTQRFDRLYRDIVSMLDYLDGIAEVGQDVPAGTQVYASPQVAQIGLLEFDPLHQALPGYLYHISLHLNGVLDSPGSTSYQRSLATKINAALDNIKRDLDQARKDAVQLVKMNNSQLAQSSTLSLLNDLTSVTTNAYQGSTGANGSQEGVLQLYPDLQKLATFSVTPYKP